MEKTYQPGEFPVRFVFLFSSAFAVTFTARGKTSTIILKGHPVCEKRKSVHLLEKCLRPQIRRSQQTRAGYRHKYLSGQRSSTNEAGMATLCSGVLHHGVQTGQGRHERSSADKSAFIDPVNGHSEALGTFPLLSLSLLTHLLELQILCDAPDV